MWLLFGFNHPSPRGLGREFSVRGLERILFQSSQPAGAGSWLLAPQFFRPSVSIIPTLAGWVVSSFFSVVLVSFQSSQPIWVESCISFISCTNSVLQSSQPAGIGSFSKNTSKSHSMFQSSQPARVGSEMWPLYPIIHKFQSSKPAGVCRLYYIIFTAVYLRFNHPNPRGLGSTYM